MMETVLKENFTGGTLLSDLWNKRTLTFGNKFKNCESLHKGQSFLFSRFVLNVLLQGILPYAEVKLEPSKLKIKVGKKGASKY